MVKKIANIEEYIHDNYRNVTELMGTILGNVSVGINKNSNEKHVLKLCNKYRSHTRLESAEMEIKIMEELCNNKSNNFLVNLICVIQDNAKYLIILEYVNGGMLDIFIPLLYYIILYILYILYYIYNILLMLYYFIYFF